MNYNDFKRKIKYCNKILYRIKDDCPLLEVKTDNKLDLIYEDEFYYYLENNEKKLFCRESLILDGLDNPMHVEPFQIIRYLDMMVNGTFYEFDIEYLNFDYGIIGYNGDSPNVTIPGVYDGKKIKYIDNIESKYMRSVFIEEGVEVICENAFKNVPHLQRLIFPKSLRGIYHNSINSEQIMGELHNGSIYLLDWLMDIAQGEKDIYEVREGTIGIAFNQLEKFENIEYLILPKSIKYIDLSILKSQIRVIEYRGTQDEWEKLDPLNIIRFKINVTFEKCTRVETDKFIYYVNRSKHIYALSGNSKNLYGDIDLGEEFSGFEIKSIAKYAFKECNNLFSIVIPDTVERIGIKAFYDCKFLMKVKLSNKLDIISDSLFEKCKILNEIVLPKDLKLIGVSAFQECKNLKAINLPESLEIIKHRAFYKCSSLENVILPEKVSSVEFQCFYECKKLKSIYIGCDQMVYIPISFANSCESLEYVRLPKRVRIIGKNAFTGCNIKVIDTKMTEKMWESVNKENFDTTNIKINFKQ